MKISNRAYLAWANEGFEAGAKIAMADALREASFSRAFKHGADDVLRGMANELDPEDVED